MGTKFMYKAAITLIAISLVVVLAHASPEADQKQFQMYFTERFPGVSLQDFADGVNAIDENAREQSKIVEEFPLYTINVKQGKELFDVPFTDGKRYADCFKNKGQRIRQYYPYFDPSAGDLKTLEQEINECRTLHGVPELSYDSEELTNITAYMTSTSRGQAMRILVPDDPRALQWYQMGKELFYTKRGQLNMSCADCHVDYAGNMIRAQTLSPALGQPLNFPAHRAKWDGMGILHRRYADCNRQVGAKPFELESDEYRALEYFQSFMSNGLEVSGPSTRN